MFMFSCAEDIPAVVLLLFCAEGDNIPEAITIVQHLNKWKKFLDDQVSHRGVTGCLIRK